MITPEEYRIEQERIRREKERLKNNPELAKKQKADEEKKKKEAAAKAKKEKELLKKAKLAAKLAKKNKKKAPPEPFSFKESPALNEMQKANEQFNEDWTRLDEETVQNDEIVMSKITDKRCYELQLEMRKVVDEMMRYVNILVLYYILEIVLFSILLFAQTGTSDA